MRLQVLNAFLCRILDIFVKRIPSGFPVEERDDIQISSATTIFGDSLDLAVDSIVLVSLGTVVGFLMNMSFRQASLTSDTKTFLTQAQDPDSAVVSLVPVTFNAEAKNRLLRGSYLASIEHKERCRTFVIFLRWFCNSIMYNLPRLI